MANIGGQMGHNRASSAVTGHSPPQVDCRHIDQTASWIALRPATVHGRGVATHESPSVTTQFTEYSFATNIQ